MKKFRTVVILMLAATFLVTGTFAYAEKFSDVVKDSWYYKTIDSLVSWGVLDGYPDGTFRPDENMTVAQCIKIICAVSDSNPGDAKTGHWASLYMASAKEEGITDPEEFPEDTWDNPINRQQLAKISDRVMKLRHHEKDNGWAVHFIHKITDWETIPDEYKDYVGQNYSVGVVIGYEDGSFRGEALATRAEASVMLMRTLSPNDRIPPHIDPVRP